MNILTYENAVKALYCAQVLETSRIGFFVEDSSFLRDKAEYLTKLGRGKIYSTQDYCMIRLGNNSVITLRLPTSSARGLSFDYVLYDDRIDAETLNTIIAPTEKVNGLRMMYTDLMDTFEPKRLFK